MTDWVRVAPIGHGGLLRRTPLPVVFAKDVCIDRLPDWFGESALTLGYPEELRRLQDAEFGIMARYRTDANPSPAEILQAGQRAYDSIMLSQMALWLGRTPLPVSHIAECVTVDGEHWVMRTVTTTDQMLWSPDIENPENLAATDLLSKTYCNLRMLQPTSTVRTAIDMSLKAITEPDWVLRYLCYWLTMEALLGADDGREISFRLSQRAAFLLR